MDIKNFTKLKNQINKVKKEKKKLLDFDLESLIDIPVRPNSKYCEWLKDNYEDWTDTDSGKNEVDYELSRPSGKVINVSLKNENNYFITVIYPNEMTIVYNIDEIDICKKNVFINECKSK